MNTEKEIMDGFLAILNEAFKSDPTALTTLIGNRVPCNEALATHPDIPVRVSIKGGDEVGLLGILNGICHRLCGRRIAMQIDTKTGVIPGFMEYNAAEVNFKY